MVERKHEIAVDRARLASELLAVRAQLAQARRCPFCRALAWFAEMLAVWHGGGRS